MTRILIAEDEPDIRDLIVFTLQFGGYEVIAASNGAEAVEKAPDAKPDLVLLDVRMPRMTGYEACVALKANPVTADIPVIFLSAKGQDAEVTSGMDAGATDYILKPFAPDVLLTRIKEILDDHQKKQAAKPTEIAPAKPPEAAAEKPPAQTPAKPPEVPAAKPPETAASKPPAPAGPPRAAVEKPPTPTPGKEAEASPGKPPTQASDSKQP
jgi:two-component system alkaline phosphatase synthesis response regulator PhoP